MEIVIKRIAKKSTYTIGKLYIDNKYFCDTLEDKDRGLKDTIAINKTDTITKLQKVTEIKVQNQLNIVQKVLMYIGLFSLLMFIIIIYKHFEK